MVVFSLFDGMSCGQIALNNLGLKDYTYYASEIDKYAIQVAKANYPKTIHLGDVTKIDFENFEKVDLLLGGSPCQGFSFAGKQLNFEDPRSKLFFDYVRALKTLKPKYFLLENVNMKKEYLEKITEIVGVEPIKINSALVSAQNRVRWYWTNIPGIEQPEDLEVNLEDIIENGIVDRDKSYCLDANYFKGGNPENYFKKSRRQLVFMGGLDEGLRLKDGKYYSRNYREGYRIYDIKGKSATLTAKSKGGLGGYSGLYGAEKEGFIYFRKLTPNECERLQTVPHDYTNHVSNTQRYKMLGNGWTVKVIEHILKGVVNV